MSTRDRARQRTIALFTQREAAPGAATPEAGMAERRAQATEIVAHPAAAGTAVPANQFQRCASCAGTGRVRADIRTQGNALTYSDRGECGQCLGTGRAPVRIPVVYSGPSIEMRIAVAEERAIANERALMIWGGTRARRAVAAMVDGRVG